MRPVCRVAGLLWRHVAAQREGVLNPRARGRVVVPLCAPTGSTLRDYRAELCNTARARSFTAAPHLPLTHSSIQTRTATVRNRGPVATNVNRAPPPSRDASPPHTHTHGACPGPPRHTERVSEGTYHYTTTWGVTRTTGSTADLCGPSTLSAQRSHNDCWNPEFYQNSSDTQSL